MIKSCAGVKSFKATRSAMILVWNANFSDYFFFKKKKHFQTSNLNWSGYLPSGLHDIALVCSSLWLRRKSTRVHRPPEPLVRVPKEEAAPDLTVAGLPG